MVIFMECNLNIIAEAVCPAALFSKNVAFIEGLLQQKAFRCIDLHTTIMHLKKPDFGSRAGKLQLHAADE